MIGRRLAWRLGRALYTRARGEGVNDIARNGEARVQREFSEWCAKLGLRSVVFDVGANRGQWTQSLIEAARQSNAARLLEIHAFEPAKDAFRMLDASCARDATEVKVHRVECALSSTDGEAPLHVAGPAAGTNSLHADATGDPLRTVRVFVRTADTYCRERGIDEVHLFKCDAEGHDPEVLLGARGLFDGAKIGVFQLEYNHRWVYARHFLKDVFDFAHGRPYRIGRLTPHGIEIIQQWHPELERFFETNYVLVRNDLLQAFSHRITTIDASNTYA